MTKYDANQKYYSIILPFWITLVQVGMTHLYMHSSKTYSIVLYQVATLVPTSTRYNTVPLYIGIIRVDDYAAKIIFFMLDLSDLLCKNLT